MKRKQKPRSEYKSLVNSIFLKTLAIIFVPLIVIFLIYQIVFSGMFSTIIVALMQKFLNVDYVRALDWFNAIFRSNYGVYLLIAIALYGIVIFRVFYKWFVRYFNDIDRGINELTDNNMAPIKLREDLASMEGKLNNVRQTLEKQTLEKQLAEQSKNDLIMYLAHDIRTPLTSIIGYLSLMDETPEMTMEQKAKYTHITLEKAYRLESLINQFFEISRYDLHEMMLEPEHFDLYYLVMQLADEFYPVVYAQEKEIIINATAEEIWLTGDPDKLARVFDNVLRNAIAYSTASSAIFINLQQNETNTTIQVTNTGKTIPQHKLDSIFGKFYRLDDARSTNIGGAGLGLAIANEIITMHEGAITAESQNGKTVFTVTLPNKE